MPEKSSKPELANRLRIVQEWILEDHPFSDIIKSVVTKWGLSTRQAERYYSSAYKGLNEGMEKDIEKKKAFYIQRKKKLLREINPAEKKTAQGALAVSKILDSMAELEGVKVNRHEHSGLDGKPIETTSTIIKVGYGSKDNSD